MLTAENNPPPARTQVPASAPDLRAWRTLAGRVFADLGRADLKERQSRLYERLLRVTLAVGRQSVRIPRWSMFERFGISRGNVSQLLSELVELGMLTVKETVDGGAVVTVLPNNSATQWRCGWRFLQSDEAEFLSHLSAVADQVQPEIFPRDLELGDALSLVSLEAGLGSQSGNHDPPVPDLGARGSQSGNLQKSSMPARLDREAPDLGTSPSLQACSGSAPDPGTKQVCKVASLQVCTGSQGPSTPRPSLQPCKLGQKASLERRGKLDPRRQELFDELEALGCFGSDADAKYNWLKFVQNHRISEVEQLIGDMRYRMENPRLPALTQPGAYANWLVRKAGLMWSAGA